MPFHVEFLMSRSWTGDGDRWVVLRAINQVDDAKQHCIDRHKIMGIPYRVVDPPTGKVLYEIPEEPAP